MTFAGEQVFAMYDAEEALLMGLVLLQFTLGIMNVVLYLPLANAVAHNACATLLLATLLGLLYKTSSRVA